MICISELPRGTPARSNHTNACTATLVSCPPTTLTSRLHRCGPLSFTRTTRRGQVRWEKRKGVLAGATMAYTNIHTYIRTYMHAYTKTHRRRYIETCIHTYIHTHIRTYARTHACSPLDRPVMCAPTDLGKGWGLHVGQRLFRARHAFFSHGLFVNPHVPDLVASSNSHSRQPCPGLHGYVAGTSIHPSTAWPAGRAMPESLHMAAALVTCGDHNEHHLAPLAVLVRRQTPTDWLASRMRAGKVPWEPAARPRLLLCIYV